MSLICVILCLAEVPRVIPVKSKQVEAQDSPEHITGVSYNMEYPSKGKPYEDVLVSLDEQRSESTS